MKTMLEIIVAAALTAAPATHAGAENSEQVRFRFDEAEMQDTASAQALYSRLQAFAKRRCRLASNRSVPHPRAKECTEELVQSLVSTIGAPELVMAARKDRQAAQLAATR